MPYKMLMRHRKEVRRNIDQRRQINDLCNNFRGRTISSILLSVIYLHPKIDFYISIGFILGKFLYPGEISSCIYLHTNQMQIKTIYLQLQYLLF